MSDTKDLYLQKYEALQNMLTPAIIGEHGINTPTLIKNKIPGRNDPCICGSGKKFKKCCLKKFEDGTYQKYKEK